MIWEQRISIIVMMTRLEERARIKCDQYWPSRGPETHADGLITVTPKETTELAYFTVRKFSVCGGPEEEMREVVHLQFTHWPDHGVPDSPITLLLFMRRIRAVISSSTSISKVRESSVPGSLLGSGTTSTSQESDLHSGPMTVHCSAGVGRTGNLFQSILSFNLWFDSNLPARYECVISCSWHQLEIVIDTFTSFHESKWLKPQRTICLGFIDIGMPFMSSIGWFKLVFLQFITCLWWGNRFKLRSSIPFRVRWK